MDNNKTSTPSSATTTNHHKSKRIEEQDDRSGGATMAGEEGGDVEMLAVFNESFKEVQSVLDRNRVLIQQVNENHQSRMADNMVKNVALIQEINGNISKVVKLYSDLSANFSSVCHKKNEKDAEDGTDTNA